MTSSYQCGEPFLSKPEYKWLRRKYSSQHDSWYSVFIPKEHDAENKKGIFARIASFCLYCLALLQS